MRRSGAALGLFAAALAGCAVGPARPPHAELLQAHSTGLVAAPAVPLAADWWQGYGDSQLDRLVDLALAGNPSLTEALARLEIAQSAAHIAGSGLGPRIRGDVLEQRERLSASSFYPPPWAGGSYWDGSADVALTWNMDFWGRQHDRINAAEQEALAGAFSLRGARLAIESAMVSQYLELDRAYAQLDVAQAGSVARTRLADLARLRVTAGLETGIEERSARAGVDDARLEAREAQLRVDLAAHRIAAIAGRGADFYASITRPAPLAQAGLALPEVLPADLLLRRGDVGAALARIRARSALAHAARRAGYPDLNLRAFAGLTAFGLSELLSAPARTLGAGLNVGLPIYNSGRLKAEVHGANAAVDLAIADYNATVLVAVREAADQLTALDTLSRQLADARNRLASVDEALRLTERRRDAGLASDIAVVEAELRVQAARRSVLGLQAADRQAQVALVVALGGSPQDSLSPSKTDAKGAQ